MPFRSSLLVAAASLAGLLGAAPVVAGIFLSAEVSETPGMAGYWTYDLTATADDGYVNGFDFTDHNGAGRGIFGPLHHGGDPSSPLYGFVDPVFGGSTGSKADTHWLVSSHDLLSIGAGQSSGSLTSASVFWGSSPLRDAHRSLPFARLVTNDPTAVNLTGQFLVGQRWSDGAAGDSVLHDVRLSLSDIVVGAPPELGALPDRPLPPVRPEPPVYVPPTYDPPAYVPPSHVPPVIVPPTIDPVTPSRVVLSAEAIDTPGLPGYRTYTVTATAIDGYLNAFDFTNFAGGTKGISGPLHHGTPSLENLGADRLFASGPADPSDSQWLVSLDDGLAIGAEQSAGVLEAAYTFTGAGGKRDTFRRLPLAQLVTNDPSAVRLIGEFALSDAWSDGSVAESWQSHLVPVSATLSDLLGVTPPELGALPDRPAPTQPPIVVTDPPVTVSPEPSDPSVCRWRCATVEPPFMEPPVNEAPIEPIDVPTVVVDPPVLIEAPAGELPGGGLVLPPLVDYPLIEIESPVVEVTTEPIDVPTVVVDPPVLIEVPAGELPGGGLVLPPLVDYPLTEIESPVVEVTTGVVKLPPTLVAIDTTWIDWDSCDDSVRNLPNDLPLWNVRYTIGLAYDGDAFGAFVRTSGLTSGTFDSALALNLLTDERSLIPEPGAGLLLGVGLLAIGARRGRGCV